MENKITLNRIFINGKNNWLITLKVEKQNILSNPKNRQLNPAKMNLAEAVKQY